jgi:uncharacterized membrane protein YhaH (DUF805 family)
VIRLLSPKGFRKLGTFGTIFSLATFLPGLAVAVRRLHDVGKSEWFLLIAFIPLVGFIWIIVLLCTASNLDDNEYGHNPKTGISIDAINTIGTNQL